MADRGKLKCLLSDNQPWRKSDFCGVGKGDEITLMPFLRARSTIEIRQELHLITKMLLDITVMSKTMREMLKAFPMVKGRSPLVVECVAWVMSVVLEPDMHAFDPDLVVWVGFESFKTGSQF